MTIDDLEGHPTAVLDALGAAHEAGHAIMHELLGVAYDLVTLLDEEGPARIEGPPRKQGQGKTLEREVLCAFAGVIAEALIFTRRQPLETVLGGISDCACIRELLGPRVADQKYIEGLQEKALSLVEANLRQVKRVAKALLLQRRLLPSEVRAAYEGLPLLTLTGA